MTTKSQQRRLARTYTGEIDLAEKIVVGRPLRGVQGKDYVVGDDVTDKAKNWKNLRALLKRGFLIATPQVDHRNVPRNNTKKAREAQKAGANKKANILSAVREARLNACNEMGAKQAEARAELQAKLVAVEAAAGDEGPDKDVLDHIQRQVNALDKEVREAGRLAAEKMRVAATLAGGVPADAPKTVTEPVEALALADITDRTKVDDIKAALTAAGIGFDSSAKKSDLLAFVGAALAPVDAGDGEGDDDGAGASE